jgi:hypothetical protein
MLWVVPADHEPVRVARRTYRLDTADARPRDRHRPPPIPDVELEIVNDSDRTVPMCFISWPFRGRRFGSIPLCARRGCTTCYRAGRRAVSWSWLPCPGDKP